MKLIDFTKEIDKTNLDLIKETFKSGNLVIFPTETVYGIGADATNKEAVEKIFLAKNRASDNPLIVHVASKEKIDEIAHINSLLEKTLIDTFMPGPFTLILEKKENIPDIVSANLNSIGVRIPENKIAQKILEHTNLPIAAPSANLSSKPSGTSVSDIITEFENTVPVIVNGGNTKIGIESTVVKVIDDTITILRPGKVTYEDLLEVTDKVIIKDKLTNEKVISPGLKYKHYAPNTKCILVYNEDSLIYNDIVKKHITNNTVIIGSKENENNFKNYTYLSYGSKENLDEISSNIFTLLRKADTYNPDLIIIEGVKKEGLGLAIMNRLLRAAQYNYIDTI